MGFGTRVQKAREQDLGFWDASPKAREQGVGSWGSSPKARQKDVQFWGASPKARHQDVGLWAASRSCNSHTHKNSPRCTRYLSQRFIRSATAWCVRASFGSASACGTCPKARQQDVGFWDHKSRRTGQTWGLGRESESAGTGRRFWGARPKAGGRP